MFAFSRRRFLHYGVAGLCVPHAASAAAPSLPIGIQLYSVGEELGRDFDGTLARLAAIGYRDVELAGTFGKSAAALKKAFAAAGLRPRSAHYDAFALQYDPERTIAFARDLGLDAMVLASPRIPRGACPTLDEWKWNADFLNIMGAMITRAGMAFGYHNHAVEFLRVGARTGYDELVERTDPALVTLQLDCGWAAAAGVDPVALLARHAGRFRSLHIKDLKTAPRPGAVVRLETAVVGSGTLDWPAILKAARAAGVVNAFVELEPPHTTPALDAARQSLAYLQQI